MNISKACTPVIITGLSILFASSANAAPPIQSMTIECNWGKLTMEAIKDADFEQGPHHQTRRGMDLE